MGMMLEEGNKHSICFVVSICTTSIQLQIKEKTAHRIIWPPVKEPVRGPCFNRPSLITYGRRTYLFFLSFFLE